jgi:hypothetical protein
VWNGRAKTCGGCNSPDGVIEAIEDVTAVLLAFNGTRRWRRASFPRLFSAFVQATRV